ncbi:hypothetical protein XO12_07825 [Marinitoga sp. 1154]|uniref:hypothetical protein n=1 Tax=Marinitoga sp. 1154 TaxID=1643335 RepID=UPI0015865152|nr:hypothetical protein [Marinitoga sp. 1154]NUV00001.1 hypothetical protein [Marinitoga sp. 1154]
MKKVITTVGTSLFSNYFDTTKNSDIDSSLKNHYKMLEDKTYSEYENNKERSDRIKSKIQQWVNNNPYASAEISSIHKTKEEFKDEDIEVYLLATDTILSFLSAEIIKEYFENNHIKGIEVYFNPKYDVILDLQVKEFNKFENGKNNLINKISNLMEMFFKDEKKFEKKMKLLRKNVLFNITGGYKGIIPIMTILAQLYECKIIYKFEESDDLVSIPRIPINFDPILTESLFIDLWFKREDNNHNFKNEDKLKEYGFIDKDNKITALGKLFYKISEFKQAISENVFGYYVEYKVLEYLYNENKSFEHSCKKFGREFDFVFKDENEIFFEIWEVKSVFRIIKDLDGVINQIKEQLKILPSIVKYKLVLYGLDERIRDKIKANVLEIKKEIFEKKYPKIQFDPTFLLIKGLGKIKEQNKKDNPYKVLFKNSLKKEDFKEI